MTMYVLASRNGLGQDIPAVSSALEAIPGSEAVPYLTTALKAYQIVTSEAPTEAKAGAAAFTAASLAMPVAGAIVAGYLALANIFFGRKQAERAKQEAERLAAALQRQARRYTEVMSPLTTTEITSMDDLRNRLLTTVRSVQEPIPPLILKLNPQWSAQSPRHVPIFCVLREWAIRWKALYPRFDQLSTELGWQNIPRPWTWPPILLTPLSGPGFSITPVFLPEMQPFFVAFEDMLASARPGTLAPPGVTVGVVRDVPVAPARTTTTPGMLPSSLLPSGFAPGAISPDTTAASSSWWWLLLLPIVALMLRR